MHSLLLEIPADIAEAARLPRARLQGQLKVELALHLYREGILDFVPARRLAEMDKADFQHLLGQRGICRQYDAGDLADDLRNLDLWRASDTEAVTASSLP